MKKKLLISIIAISLIFSSSVITAEVPTEKENEIVFLNEELESLENEVPYEVRLAMENQVEALDCYQNIYNSFSKDEHGMPVYPDEYAGAYIEDGNLIVQLIDNSSEMQEKYLLLCNHSDKIIFREVEYSLNELAAYEEYATSMLENGYDVIGFGIREKDNTFEITLNANSTSSINTYSLFGASETELPIKILYQEQAVACAPIWGGDEIINESNNMEMTVGICGTYKEEGTDNEKDALLTCGHGNEKSGIFNQYPYIEYDDETIGQVSYQRANTSEMANWIDTLGDFAIVTIDNDDVTITNRICGQAIAISGTYSSLPEGTTIYKYGISSGLSYGTITRSGNTWMAYYDGHDETLDYKVRGLYESEMQNASGTDAILSGDSGGPVYIKSGSNYLLHGIVAAGRDSLLDMPASTMYSSPIAYAEAVGFGVKID